MQIARVCQGLAFASLAASLAPSPARGFDFFEGRLQVHGFYEAQVRSISRDFDEEWDLTQWYNVLNIELEADVAPDGWGPFDMVSAYARVEARYDCVWTHACTLFDSANTYGKRSLYGRLPKRMVDGHRSGYTANALNSRDGRPDTRPFYDVPWFAESCDPDDLACLKQQQQTVLDGPAGSRKPIRVWQQFAFVRQSGTSPGADQAFDLINALPLCPLPFNRDIFCGRLVRYDSAASDAAQLAQLNATPTYTDDPGANLMRALGHCFYGEKETGGPENGQGGQTLLLSIDGCRVHELGVLRQIPNPFNPHDINPWLGRARNGNGQFIDANGNVVSDFRDAAPLAGSTALPFRPAPALSYTDVGNLTQAQGIYYPSRELAQTIRDGDFEKLPHFTQADLAWNHGQSQEQTKELKEFYLDLEFFDSRLWVRAGKQNIVWGKTELFRTTDQFNPQDLALSSLPSLEESRIALWALRGVWSFYDVGPLEDVRLELAMNFDEFQPSDLGRCGEPYVIDLVCQGTFGLQIHGVLGLGVAGVVEPPDPWQSTKGLEFGGRVEWRWDRFSFAISDFYGYNDFPTVDQITRYSRNVDPQTGRPRYSTTTDRCDPDGAFGPPDSSGCLVGVPPGYNGKGSDLPPHNALQDHSVNQQMFAWICGMTLGVTSLDPTACGNTIFNSYQNLFTSQPATDPLTQPTLASFASGLLAANSGALGFAAAPQAFGVVLPAIRLNRDPGDSPTGSGFFAGNPNFDTLNLVLSPQQEALLGCGEYYGTNCDVQGFDLLNAEASAFFQSFSGFEGTASFATGYNWSTLDGSVAQPGTVYFQGGPVCTRYENGKTYVLPGCRGPGPDGVGGTPDDDPGYAVDVDGTTTIAGGGQHDLIVPFFDPDSPFFQGTDGKTPCQTPSASFNGCQRFQNEFAALSWNLEMMLVGFSSSSVVNATGDQIFDPDDPFNPKRCSFQAPHFCIGVSGFLDFARVQRATVRAGGNARYGRRDFVWQMGTPLKVRYEKRNVLGFSMDWAEDFTKSNWSVETTWIEGEPVFDSDEVSGTRPVDTYNLTVSVDRPTFVNFLNQNRTFFVNSQWFIQYVDGYRQSMPGEGPWNVLGTLTVQTGYFQDRLLPTITFVYDVRSNSGAVLPSIAYRFTENFSVTVGAAGFFGHEEYRTTAVTQIGAENRVHKHKDEDVAFRGLAAIMDRDEAFLRVKYTF